MLNVLLMVADCATNGRKLETKDTNEVGYFHEIKGLFVRWVYYYGIDCNSVGGVGIHKGFQATKPMYLLDNSFDNCPAAPVAMQLSVPQVGNGNDE